MMKQELTLTRDCEATIVPAGDTVTLEKGSVVNVKQALGGTITVYNDLGLFRINSNNLDALGQEVAESLVEEAQEATGPFGESQVWDALKACFDPEIPINIVDLGLIYDLALEEKENNQFHVSVKMTLTAQGCGMGPTIAADAKDKIEALPAVASAQVDIVWDPVWNPQMISEDGRKLLGLN